MELKDMEFQMRQVRLDVVETTQYDPGKALQQIFDLLKVKDDTQRFVALSLMKYLLEGNGSLQRNIPVLMQCWTAIPPTFLTRIFKSQAQASTDPNAKNLFELAVSIVHSFIVLLQNHLSVILPKGMGTGLRKHWKQRVEAEMSGITSSPQVIRTLIFQTFLSFAHTVEGASVLTEVEDWTPLLYYFPGNILVKDMFWTTYMTLGKAGDQVSIDKVSRSFGKNFAVLASIWAKEPVTILEDFFEYIVNSILAKVPVEIYRPTSAWLEPLVKLIVTSTVTPRKGPAFPKLKAKAVKLASILTRIHPVKTTELLFSPNIRQENASSAKPLSYLFLKLILVDIKSTIPSLLEQINATTYRSTSERLACSYDILSAFTNYLVGAAEDTNPDLPLFAPDLLLQLRTDISQTLSLTIEYLRDCYDASIGGAPGLHPSSRAPTMALTWDYPTGFPNDLLIPAQIRALALWIREDDGEDLRKEAAGITDVLLNLYSPSDTSTSTATNPRNGEDPSHEIEVALEGICNTSEGIHAFISENGYAKLLSKLSSLLTAASSSSSSSTDAKIDFDRGLGIQLLLLKISNSGEIGPTKEEYLSSILSLAAGMKLANGCPKGPQHPTDPADPASLQRAVEAVQARRRDEFLTGILDLAYDALGRASRGLRQKYRGLAEKVLSKAQKMAEREREEGYMEGQAGGVAESLGQVISGEGSGHGVHII
ncbi:MAG: hypothetical protein MMC33_002663 [Icmadophila ericetorum]|nr:hypothetical protein [Icmadophila ericetorum]